MTECDAVDMMQWGGREYISQKASNKAVGRRRKLNVRREPKTEDDDESTRLRGQRRKVPLCLRWDRQVRVIRWTRKREPMGVVRVLGDAGCGFKSDIKSESKYTFENCHIPDATDSTKVPSTKTSS